MKSKQKTNNLKNQSKKTQKKNKVNYERQMREGKSVVYIFVNFHSFFFFLILIFVHIYNILNHTQTWSIKQLVGSNLTKSSFIVE